MRNRLIKNPGLKLLSIVLAFIIWLAVVNISNPEVTRSKTVELEIQNANILTNASKSFTLSNSGTVTVSYEVRTTDESRIKASDFKATVDMEDLYDVTGSVPVNVEVVSNKDLIIGTPYARPGVIQVTTEDIQKKKFTLSTNATGTPTDGYSVGSIDVDPPAVTVSGPVSEVGRISSVGIEVNVDGESRDLSGSITPVFYDANGNRINRKSDKVTVDPQQVAYKVTMLRGKSLSLNFDVSGSVADGYRYTGAECNVKSVSVVGQKEVLDSVSTVDIPESVLSVQGATGDRQVKVNVSDYLPSGVSISGNSEIVVTLKVEALQDKEFTLTLDDISQVGQTSGYAYMLDPESITVDVTGLTEDLGLIKPSDLKAEVDFTHMSKGTVHDGTLTFDPPKGYAIKSYTPFKIIVYDANGEKPVTEGPGMTATDESTSESAAETSSGSAGTTISSGSAGTTGASGESPAKPTESVPETLKTTMGATKAESSSGETSMTQ